jgi:hypothetical protein
MYASKPPLGNACTHTHTRTHTHTHKHVHAHTRTHTHKHTLTHAHTHARAHAHTITYTHTCTHTRIHTCTFHTCRPSWKCTHIPTFFLSHLTSHCYQRVSRDGCCKSFAPSTHRECESHCMGMLSVVWLLEILCTKHAS